MAIAKLLFKFGADIREVIGAVAKVESEIGKISKSFGSLGRTFLGGASAAALLDIGKNAIIASSKFESSFLKIKNLTDSTAADLGLFKKSLSGISNEVGKPIADLVDGLYSITSAGLSGQAALDTLRIAAKASAIGMGEVDTIAKTIGATLNAYGVANISASKAANILFNTTKLGAVDVAELAPAMGQVIPIASAMGVSFDQVGGAIAAMSLQGIGASDAVTSLVSIMNAMLKPSSEAEKLLEGVGLSMQQVRDVARNDFSAAINLVSTAFKGNESAISSVLGRVEGLKGFLAISGSNFERYSQIVKQTGADMASFDKATDEALKTTAARWDRFSAQASNALLRFGDGLKNILIGIDEYVNKTGIMEAQQKRLAANINYANQQIEDQVKVLRKLGGIPEISTGGPLAADKVTPFPTKPVKPTITKTNTTGPIRDELTILQALNKERERLLNLIDKATVSQQNAVPIIEELKAVEYQLKEIEQARAIALDSLSRSITLPKIPSLGEVQRDRNDGKTPELTSLTNTDALSPLTKSIQGSNEETKKLMESLGQVGTVLTGIGEASAQAFGAMAAELLTGGVAFKDLGKFALEAARSIVKAALSEALATAIVSALKSSKGNLLLGIGLAVSGVALVSSLFKSKVPKLARGGLAFGPQLAIVGDNPNARTDPEVISPLSKLKGIMAAEVLRLGSILSQAFNASLKNVNFGAGTPSQIKVNIPSISSLLNGIGPIINPSSAFDFAPAPINVNVTGQVFGNDIRLLNDRLGATNNRIKGNKYQ